MRAPADGSTLLLHTGSTAITTPVTRKIPPYTADDFSWIARLATAPFAIAAYPGIPVTNLQSLIAYIRARPGQLSYGHSGVGTTLHLTAEAFNKAAGLDILAVPYRGYFLESGFADRGSPQSRLNRRTYPIRASSSAGASEATGGLATVRALRRAS